MNIVNRLFGKNLISPARKSSFNPLEMLAVGILQQLLAREYGQGVVLSQIETHMWSTIDESVGYEIKERKKVDVEAYFILEKMERRTGREFEAPIPPKVVISIDFVNRETNVMHWVPVEIHLRLENIDEPAEKIHPASRLASAKIFSQHFNQHRPHGFSVMRNNEDYTIWTINPRRDQIPRGY